MNNNIFESLQNWYFNQCDGDWEHEFGIKIDTLDNPGWLVEIDLTGTENEGKTFQDVDQQISELDWLQCSVKNKKFIGAGGPKNLSNIISVFLAWKAENNNAK